MLENPNPNPNPFAVRVTAITPGAVTVTGAPGCAGASSAVVFAVLAGSWTVVAEDTSDPVDVPAGVSMGATSASACQGAVFQAVLTTTVTRVG